MTGAADVLTTVQTGPEDEVDDAAAASDVEVETGTSAASLIGVNAAGDTICEAGAWNTWTSASPTFLVVALTFVIEILIVFEDTVRARLMVNPVLASFGRALNATPVPSANVTVPART